MAVPSRVPIANTAPLADNEPQPAGTRSVAAVLAERKTSLIADWLTRTKKTPKLNHLRLGRPKLPDRDSDAIVSPTAVEHGQLRRSQGYSSGLLIYESRILQVTIFGAPGTNIGPLWISTFCCRMS
jgi:hypothetical protein